ncbi:MAG: patatin [Phycisphaeraceae bacterium]|nr:MAG: patatin [Phycisphaeraceae bacterium]
MLSIDGGGIRGLIPAMILAEVEKRSGTPIASMFDLIAGTSTGGILTLGLTAPGRGGAPKYAASDLVDLYHREGERIFPRPLWRKLPGAAFIADVLDERYPSRGIEETLEEYFGEAILSEALTDVLVTSYAIERRDTFFFKSHNAKARGKAYDFLARDVARATSAAPTFFEPAMIRAIEGAREDYYALVDGGVFANNPAMCAIAEAVGPKYDRPMSDVVVASLGTGHTNRPIRLGEARGWGLAGWVRPVLSVMMDGMADSVAYQCQQILPSTGVERRYCRIDEPLIDVDDDMDNASERNLRDLARFADRVIGSRSADIDWIVKTMG